ncbi:hypothetical protein HB884_07790 [Listeria booriae]|uniref:Uncharacterized protein n=1 Tax=Listeria booriae TaxID=1552123 RepID=A0A7X1CC01_9LIST|nr:hypothetical protein [Listeria booriae]MBC1491956.1 hypothetical protein [Listeria booriae]MBC1524106.1 hypothetical protein [Listeria booriae]
MSFKIAYEFDDKNVFVRDSVIFPSFSHVTDDGKEFNDYDDAKKHQRELFPLEEVIDLEYLNDSEEVKEGEEGEMQAKTMLVEPPAMPEILTKEIFVLPENCTWTAAPNPSNNAVWDSKKQKWVNGSMPDMIPPTPSELELLKVEMESAKQDAVELREILLDIVTDNLE